MFKFKIVSLFSIVFAFFLAITNVVQAEDVMSQLHPQEIIKKSTKEMLQALRDNKEALEQEPAIIYGFVKDILLPNFDFNKMSKLALGKNWRKADVQQKSAFTKEFRLLIIRTYSTAMVEYADNEIVFLPFKGDLEKKKVKIKTEVLQAGGPSIPMALSMYLNKEKAWKIYDVKIDGISLVTNYRSTFANKIRKSGLAQLIDDLAARNAVIKETEEVSE